MARKVQTLALALAAAVMGPAQDEFSRRLTPEELKASGLDRLSWEEIAVLDALVQRDRRKSARPIPVPPASKPSQEVPPVPPTAPPALAPAESNPGKKKSTFGLPARDDADIITGTLVGEYRGWSGTTVFRFEDGQVWVQTDSHDSHQATPRQSPRAKIEKSVFGGYKLTVEGSPMWVRVRRVQ